MPCNSSLHCDIVQRTQAAGYLAGVNQFYYNGHTCAELLFQFTLEINFMFITTRCLHMHT